MRQNWVTILILPAQGWKSGYAMGYALIEILVHGLFAPELYISFI